MNMVQHIRQEIKNMNKVEPTIVVHCSDGSGRTGTFLALYTLMEIMDEKLNSQVCTTKESSTTTANKMIKDGIDIFETVLSLRSQRMQMVIYIDMYV